MLRARAIAVIGVCGGDVRVVVGGVGVCVCVPARPVSRGHAAYAATPLPPPSPSVLKVLHELRSRSARHTCVVCILITFVDAALALDLVGFLFCVGRSPA